MQRMVVLSCLVFFCAHPFAQAVSPNAEIIKTKVLSVHDGDTFTVEIDNEKERIRILGIDAPELEKGQDDCGGENAGNLLRALIDGKSVTLVRDDEESNRDAFGRLLRIVKIRDHVDVSIIMLVTGRAKVYQNTNFDLKSLYVKLARIAERSERGVWSKSCVEQTNEKNSSKDQKGADNTNIDYSCGHKLYCSEMETCEEAEYYLNKCQRTSLDSDADGIPCESICKE